MSGLQPTEYRSISRISGSVDIDDSEGEVAIGSRGDGIGIAVDGGGAIVGFVVRVIIFVLDLSLIRLRGSLLRRRGCSFGESRLEQRSEVGRAFAERVDVAVE